MELDEEVDKGEDSHQGKASDTNTQVIIIHIVNHISHNYIVNQLASNIGLWRFITMVDQSLYFDVACSLKSYQLPMFGGGGRYFSNYLLYYLFLKRTINLGRSDAFDSQYCTLVPTSWLPLQSVVTYCQLCTQTVSTLPVSSLLKM